MKRPHADDHRRPRAVQKPLNQAKLDEILKEPVERSSEQDD